MFHLESSLCDLDGPVIQSVYIEDGESHLEDPLVGERRKVESRAVPRFQLKHSSDREFNKYDCIEKLYATSLHVIVSNAAL